MPVGNAWQSITVIVGHHLGVTYQIRKSRNGYVATLAEGTEEAARIWRDSPGEALVAIVKMIDAGAGR